MRNLVLVTFVVLCVALWGGAAGASTFLVLPDATMVSQAPLIAEVSVMSASPSPASGIPSTDYIVLVERLLKGWVGGTSIVVRVPGGERADGLVLDVHGSPTFREGERALLFLVDRSDGTYGVLHLALGAFRQRVVELDGGPQAVAVRDLSESGTLAPGDGVDPARAWEAFAAWIGATAEGERLPAGYFLEPGAVSAAGPLAIVDTLAWSEFGRQRRIRWRVSDESESRSRDLGSEMVPRRQTVRRAIDVWQNPETSAVRMGIGARLASQPTLTRPDGANAIVVGDPEEVSPGSFSCRSGGVVALSATWFDPAVTFRFRTGADGVATRALEADLVLNQGAECLFEGRLGRTLGAAVVAHELGHALGLSHSSDPASVMFPILLDRGGLTEASAEERDRLGFLYPPEADRRSGPGAAAPLDR